jgi:uncharacterized protein YlxW (UPF0749 family)
VRAGLHRIKLWRLLVPVTAALGGLVLATSAVTAGGTELRAGPTRLSDLLRQQERTLASQVAQERALRALVTERTRQVAVEQRPVATVRAQADALAGPAGLTPVRGPAVTVRLADAPRSGEFPAAGTPAPDAPAAPRPDDLVVHQQDVQGVVNALWSGGAEAMTIMGKRVISTTAVRCVGNTLLLQNAVYSPPFVISALGDPARLVAALDADPDVSIFRQYVAVYGLGYAVSRAAQMTFPAYDGPLDLRYALL